MMERECVCVKERVCVYVSTIFEYHDYTAGSLDSFDLSKMGLQVGLGVLYKGFYNFVCAFVSCLGGL